MALAAKQNQVEAEIHLSKMIPAMFTDVNTKVRSSGWQDTVSMVSECEMKAEVLPL